MLKAPRSEPICVCFAWLLTIDLARLAAQSSKIECDQEYDSGLELQQKGDLAGARKAYETALQLCPQRIDALSNLGLTYAGLRDYGKAVASFDRALRLDPKQPIVLFNLSLTYLQMGQNENARRRLAELVQVQSGDFKAHHYFGVSLLKLGHIEEGISELERVVDSHPEDLDAAYTLCSAYLASKQFGKAQALIERSISLHDTAAAHLIEGTYYMSVEDYRHAVVQFRRAEQLDPGLPGLKVNLGSAYALTGSQDAAIRVFEARLRKNPSDFTALGFLGWLYLESDRLDDADRMLEKAHAIKPNDPDVLFQMGRLARQRGQFEKAAELLQDVTASRPGDVKAHVLLAQTYFRLKKTAEANREEKIIKRLNEEQGINEPTRSQ